MALAGSLAVSVYHVKPKMWSGRIPNKKNLRTVYGTEQYGSTEDYMKELGELDLTGMIKANCEQIVGMNKNIWRNQQAIQWAVFMTLLGLLVMLIVFVRMYVWLPSHISFLGGLA